MNELNLAAIWQESGPPATQFEPAKLAERRVRPAVEWLVHECAPFQVSLLGERRGALSKRLLWLPPAGLAAIAAGLMVRGSAVVSGALLVLMLVLVAGVLWARERRVIASAERALSVPASTPTVGALGLTAIATMVLVMLAASAYYGIGQVAAHRVREVNRLLKECREASAQGEWAIVRQRCGAALDLDPRSDEARLLLQRADLNVRPDAGE